MTLEQEIHTIGRHAREASRALARLSASQKNKILIAMADELVVRSPEILAANAEDTAAAEKNGLTKAVIDRLRLTPDRISGMADGIREAVARSRPIEFRTFDGHDSDALARAVPWREACAMSPTVSALLAFPVDDR